MKKKLLWIVLASAFIHISTVLPDIQEEEQPDISKEYDAPDSYLHKKPHGKPFNNINREKVSEYFRHFLVDTVNVWSYVLSLDTMNLLLPIIPAYLTARFQEKRIHNKFYNCSDHTNKHQPSKWLRAPAVDDGVVAIPFIIFGGLGLAATDPYLRREAQTFTTGLVWAWATKVVFKELIKTESCLRPWNEHYSATEQSHGGNPSGHLTTLTFLVTYWAFKWGLPWVIPMGAYTLYAMAVNVAVNHHYLSQVVAGAGLGIIFGVAAHSAFDFVAQHDNIVVGFDATGGKPGIKLTYSF